MNIFEQPLSSNTISCTNVHHSITPVLNGNNLNERIISVVTGINLQHMLENIVHELEISSRSQQSMLMQKIWNSLYFFLTQDGPNLK